MKTGEKWNLERNKADLIGSSGGTSTKTTEDGFIFGLYTYFSKGFMVVRDVQKSPKNTVFLDAGLRLASQSCNGNTFPWKSRRRRRRIFKNHSRETQLFEEKLEISRLEEERNLFRSGDGEWETLEWKQSWEIPPETSGNIHRRASWNDTTPEKKTLFSELLSFASKRNRNPSSASKLTKDTTTIRTLWGRSLWLLDGDLQPRHRELQPTATLHHVCRGDAAWLRGEICVWWISCGFHLCRRRRRCRCLSSSAPELKHPAPKTTVRTEGWCRNSSAERRTPRRFQFLISIAETMLSVSVLFFFCFWFDLNIFFMPSRESGGKDVFSPLILLSGSPGKIEIDC